MRIGSAKEGRVLRIGSARHRFAGWRGGAAGPALGNPFEYYQLVGALMFFVNSRPNCSEYIESVYGRASSHTLDRCQESFEISLRHSHLWTEIHCWECESPWLF